MDTFERYEILGELGHGGMATVYRARDKRLGRFVALKVLHPHLRATPEARERFAREARTAARLEHDNIVRILDCSEEHSDASYIATELLTGPTLNEFAHAHPDMPPEIVACIGIELSRALSVAHAAGVVHRDVKPENVLLHEARCIKLADFGIAHVRDAHSFTVTGQLLGSPAHMAPEQVDGRECDARTDIFALGTLLYTLATGTRPFEGAHAHHVLRLIAEGSFADPLRLRPEIGAPLQRVILRALQKAPADRYPTAEALEQDLVALLTRVGIDDSRAELANYLGHPGESALLLRAKVVHALVRRAEEAIDDGRLASATDDLNRVFAMDDAHEQAHQLLSVLQACSRRARRRNLTKAKGALLGAGALAALGAWVIIAQAPQSTRPPRDARPLKATSTKPHTLSKRLMPSVSPAPPAPDAPSGASLVATPSPERRTGPTHAPPRASDSQQASRTRHLPSAPLVPRKVVFRPTPSNVSIGVDGAAPRPFGPSFQGVDLLSGPHRFEFVGAQECCLDEIITVVIPDGKEPFVLAHRLKYRDARLYVVANVAAGVRVDGRIEGRAREFVRVPLDETLQETHSVIVTAPGYKDYTTDVTLRAGAVQQLAVHLERLPEDT